MGQVALSDAIKRGFLLPRIGELGSRISDLVPRTSDLVSRISYLVSRISDIVMETFPSKGSFPYLKSGGIGWLILSNRKRECFMKGCIPI